MVWEEMSYYKYNQSCYDNEPEVWDDGYCNFGIDIAEYMEVEE